MIVQQNAYDVYKNVLTALNKTNDTFGGMWGTDVQDVVNNYYGASFKATALEYPVPNDTPSASGPSILWERRLRAALFGNDYPIVLVTINGTAGETERGKLLSSQSVGASHWVVVTGLSRLDQWENEQLQWIRIKNPFENQDEYYRWQRFTSSIRSGWGSETHYGNLVIVSHL